MSTNLTNLNDSLDLSLRKYLMSSYLYYHLNLSIFEDSDYDELCKYLLANFDQLEDTRGVTKADLEAGTGYSLVYSNYCKHAAETWYKSVKDNKEN